ncbi:hypothetical protein GUJ93_ZPchr0013g34738 [Zizania palustris]|uniref:Expansin-like EG45 domain-containing protein n=1 Tax=Zizania palustris TaxID=103762 RepID=A0A8J5X397_ZIZPA|nr:hypothetical protein GUJ93_ZPchr0013g34738 [Zizania palustris]
MAASRSFWSVAVAVAVVCLLASHGCSSASKHKQHAPKSQHSGAGASSNNNSSSSTNSSSKGIPPPPMMSPGNGSSDDGGGWLNARATWYGAPNGAGPDDNGGACGFKNVNMPPFSAMTSCGNEPLFKDGKGCGSCYQIRCVGHPACSGFSETVIITDMNYYPVSLYHFDLSGTAFGAMAKDDRNDELRHAGIIDIQFRRHAFYSLSRHINRSYIQYLRMPALAQHNLASYNVQRPTRPPTLTTTTACWMGPTNY